MTQSLGSDPGDIYLDCNATTPCDARVLSAMTPFFSECYGNPANGSHRQGRQAARAVSEAREQVATLIGAQPFEIVFTAGAAESNNLAILGYARANRGRRRHQIVTTSVEHKAALEPCRKLAGEGFDIVVMPDDSHGRVSLEPATGRN